LPPPPPLHWPRSLRCWCEVAAFVAAQIERLAQGGISHVDVVREKQRVDGEDCGLGYVHNVIVQMPGDASPIGRKLGREAVQC
jgi:hypothetical protein